MLGFLSPKLIGIGLFLLAVASAVGYHYWTINKLNTEILKLTQDIKTITLDLQTSEENNNKLKVALNEQQASLQRIEEQRLKEVRANNELREKFKTAEGNVNKLKKILSKHDLNYLSLQKPGLIQNRINGGTQGVGERIEEITQ